MLNKVMLIGNLGGDPEVRHTQTSKVANFNIATTSKWKDASGSKKERTDWHRVVAWSPYAEVVEKYLHKGSRVYIEGELQTRKFQGKEGSDRFVTEVVVNTIRLLDASQAADSKPTDRGVLAKAAASQAPLEDDFPF